MQKDRLKEAFSKFIEQTYKYCIIGIFVCWFMKLFGIDWFGLDLDNKFFRDLDLFLTKYYLKDIFITVLLNLQLYLMIGSVYKERNNKNWLFLLKLLPITIIVRLISIHIGGTLSLILEFIFIVFVSCKFNLKKILKAIAITIFLLIYQGISLNTRSLDLKAHSFGFVASQLLSIDFYLLLCLHKEMEVKMMGNDGTWLFFGLTAWIYGVAGAIVGIFKLHPIRTAKEWYARGKEKENARKTEKELKKIRGK